MKRNIVIGVYVLVLSLASAYVVVDGSAAEPYISFHYSDAFVQVGIAVALMAFWLQFVAWLVYSVITRRMARVWLLLTIWVGIAVFNLSHSPGAYIGDITKFVIEKQ